MHFTVSTSECLPSDSMFLKFQSTLHTLQGLKRSARLFEIQKFHIATILFIAVVAN